MVEEEVEPEGEGLEEEGPEEEEGVELEKDNDANTILHNNKSIYTDTDYTQILHCPASLKG